MKMNKLDYWALNILLMLGLIMVIFYRNTGEKILLDLLLVPSPIGFGILMKYNPRKKFI